MSGFSLCSLIIPLGCDYFAMRCDRASRQRASVLDTDVVHARHRALVSSGTTEILPTHFLSPYAALGRRLRFPVSIDSQLPTPP